MTSSHRVKIFFAKIRWFFDVRKARRRAYKRMKRVHKLRKETEMLYNEKHRKNPTHHDALRLEGKLEVYKELFDE